jgi:RNA recognition motif-containing protein
MDGVEYDFVWVAAADFAESSESTSIPKNPRTDRPVGYAFVDLSTPSEAERAIAELSGKEILERKVSVQLARKPEPAGEKTEGAASGGEGVSGGEGARRRPSGRGRGRGRGRGGRGARTGGRVSNPSHMEGTHLTFYRRMALLEMLHPARSFLFRT